VNGELRAVAWHTKKTADSKFESAVKEGEVYFSRLRPNNWLKGGEQMKTLSGYDEVQQ